MSDDQSTDPTTREGRPVPEHAHDLPDVGHRADTGVRRAGLHPVDPVSLVAGVVAVGLALVALLDVDVDAGVVVPLLLVVAGLIGLVATLRRQQAPGR